MNWVLQLYPTLVTLHDGREVRFDANVFIADVLPVTDPVERLRVWHFYRHFWVPVGVSDGVAYLDHVLLCLLMRCKSCCLLDNDQT
jgi:hypothetical protein